MNDVWIALIVAIPPTLAGIATLVLVIRQKKSLTEIHTLTNSNLTEVQVNLEKANQEIIDLKQLVGKITEQRKELAEEKL